MTAGSLQTLSRTASPPLLLLAAIAAGTSYLPASWLLPHGQGIVAWKGLGVGLVALWAWRALAAPDRYWVAGFLALGALGDVLIDATGLIAGALAFLAGHLVATVYYLRHRRAEPLQSWAPIALGRFVIIPVLAFSFPADRSAAPGVALYALGLAAMAASAWMSRFPRRRVSLGALLFAVSDLLIFARMGPLAGSMVPTLGIWPLYFAGQVLIATGIVGYLGRQHDPAIGAAR